MSIDRNLFWAAVGLGVGLALIGTNSLPDSWRLSVQGETLNIFGGLYILGAIAGVGRTVGPLLRRGAQNVALPHAQGVRGQINQFLNRRWSVSNEGVIGSALIALTLAQLSSASGWFSPTTVFLMTFVGGLLRSARYEPAAPAAAAPVPPRPAGPAPAPAAPPRAAPIPVRPAPAPAAAAAAAGPAGPQLPHWRRGGAPYIGGHGW